METIKAFISNVWNGLTDWAKAVREAWSSYDSKKSDDWWDH